MDIKKYLKDAGIGFLGIFIYFFLGSIKELPFKLLNIDISILPSFITILYSIIYCILIICLLFLLFNKSLGHDFKDLKINHKKYFSKYFKYYLIGLAIMYISNFIIIFVINKDLANNEETIRNLFQVTPFYIYFSAVFLAPITEELVFRKCLNNIFPNKYIFIAMSGLIFGYLHISTSLNSLFDFIYIIPYASLGIAFAYIFDKTKNIYVSVGFHMMHNGILLGLQFLVLLFG